MEITIGILCFLLVCAVVGIIYYRNACEMLRCTIEQQERKLLSEKCENKYLWKRLAECNRKGL
ncbi:MAG: hypothetical protein RRZ66_07495 [Bacteroidales bacterium]